MRRKVKLSRILILILIPILIVSGSVYVIYMDCLHKKNR